MAPYLPTVHNLIGAAGLLLTLGMFLVLGAACGGRRALPETKLLTGWGAACLVLTFWGLATPLDMRWPLAGLAACALGVIAVPGGRARIAPLGGVGRVAIVALPLWLIMLPLLPSEIDTWLNLLPNAAYLFDYGMFPTGSRPPSYSFLPVAPYNTQFAAFAASVATGSFAEGVMGLFNIALLCVAGLFLARIIASGTIAAPAVRPPWWACALGLLVAIAANPGFVPRVFLSPYGESPLAVTVLFAVWLAADTLDDLARAVAWPRPAVALAFVLAAMVNIKQSGLGLVLPVGVTMLAIGLLHPRIGKGRVLAVTTAAMLPALALYALWRPFASASFPEGELKLLPLLEWNWPLLPGIFAAMLHAMYQKVTYFAFVAVALAFAVRALRRAPWSREGMLLGMVGGIVVLFTGFLVFTYVAHFPPFWALEAHSFFRYESQLSLAVMLALVVAIRPALAARLAARAPLYARRLGIAVVGLALVLPVLGIRLLRFDLDAPQPEIRQFAADAAAYIAPGARIALLLPDDRDDAVGSMLRGVLMFTPPRRPGLDIRVETRADTATLAAVAADGFSLALVSCTPPALADAPPGRAALLKRDDGGWHTLESTAYPTDLPTRRFGAMLQRGPVCGERPRVAAGGQATQAQATR